MSGKLELAGRMKRSKANNRRSVETLGTAARAASGRMNLAMNAEVKCWRTRHCRLNGKLWKRRLPNGLEATEGQTAELATDSRTATDSERLRWRSLRGVDVRSRRTT